MRVKDTIRINKDGRTQEYMQVWLTFQSRQPIAKKRDELTIHYNQKEY